LEEQACGCTLNRVTDESVPHIELCQNEDLPHLEAILEQSPEAAFWSAAQLAETLASHPSHFLVAWQGKQIVGFISGRRVADEGEILNLAVRPLSRQQGISKALLQELLDLFARECVTCVFLEVRQSNNAAINFYSSLQFRQIAQRPSYYRNPAEPAIVLAKQLHISDSTAQTN
jgi:ribosomal-protein-alanine N-acetyltransferase